MQLSPQHMAQVVDHLRRVASRSDSEKRRAPRVEVRCKVAIAIIANGMIASQMNVILQDISFLGVGLYSSVALPKETEFLIRLQRNNKEELLVQCVAKYSRELADNIFFIGGEYLKMIDKSVVEVMQRVTKNELDRIQSSVLG
jgi:hypothetical protein